MLVDELLADLQMKVNEANLRRGESGLEQVAASVPGGFHVGDIGVRFAQACAAPSLFDCQNFDDAVPQRCHLVRQTGDGAGEEVRFRFVGGHLEKVRREKVGRICSNDEKHLPSKAKADVKRIYKKS